MKKTIKLMALTFIIIGLSACGRTGELEKVKSSSVTSVVTHIA
ncbi:hypothetical protein [uncultured Gammaproteobacteria bacterium]|jgi:predicted small lipoprotein YifL|uniref:Secreted protein n=1 Tax=Bathymodiolus azoricus thioautotrophic gill symbiont TaxID=235205 RepID=A0A1H6KN56_9GAMM|nr:hypothetical protein [Bathymodiolus azoricus thioautotrophic gill symbiont]CAC9484047.1 hypothetical protein [uncultured Gammaproteobacteria bacterium]CAC9485276.1 hypothetical protein [uncultured Gammaproteobacteria bacterium]CAC9506348.1 hypothetical protein [uncultured Gammaproteobacteria bacterium]CAC9513535.1 hypothetical protein [uncultured Gammaproteobacteria bacterium]CAC9519792.1 hypothetical protein [uncultured Gammaproteobacteria bacterium]